MWQKRVLGMVHVTEYFVHMPHESMLPLSQTTDILNR